MFVSSDLTALTYTRKFQQQIGSESTFEKNTCLPMTKQEILYNLKLSSFNLLHNTDVAKSLMVSRFIQKEIADLCETTTEFRYDKYYLTVSMAIANLHYNENLTQIMDSYESWYKRCNDALKTIRYEGGNGVTHADVLFGIKAGSNQSPVASHGFDIHHQIGFGIVHTIGSKTSENGILQQIDHEQDHFAAFNNNLV